MTQFIRNLIIAKSLSIGTLQDEFTKCIYINCLNNNIWRKISLKNINRLKNYRQRFT